MDLNSFIQRFLKKIPHPKDKEDYSYKMTNEITTVNRKILVKSSQVPTTNIGSWQSNLCTPVTSTCPMPVRTWKGRKAWRSVFCWYHFSLLWCETNLFWIDSRMGKYCPSQYSKDPTKRNYFSPKCCWIQSHNSLFPIEILPNNLSRNKCNQILVNIPHIDLNLKLFHDGLIILSFFTLTY